MMCDGMWGDGMAGGWLGLRFQKVARVLFVLGQVYLGLGFGCFSFGFKLVGLVVLGFGLCNWVWIGRLGL